ncbi:wolframin [Planococcus citri]|uniref:wolframin n=1 Tax=Planococcus citri TaxID=170843 RepID=UPI0031F9D39D
MAGNLDNNIFRKSGRKKWTLFRGSRGLFQRVGTEMAEDGCPDAQFKLAKDLIEKPCDSPAEEKENATEGVYWLLRASEQGHVEATELLKQCLEEGKGITEHNISEVIECLETTRNEKISVKAIKDLFMNFSEGEEFITSNQLLSKLREVEQIENTKKLPQIEANRNQVEDWKDRIDQPSGHKLTEDVLVSAARTYARGELPTISHSLVLPERSICNLKYVNSVFKLFLFPLTFSRFYSYLLSFNPRLLLSLFYVSPAHLKIFLFIIVYQTFKFEAIFSALPMLVFYSSFLIMIAATCQMLKYRKRLRHFRCWSNLFLLYGGESFSPEEAEFLHCRNGVSAYGFYFVFLLVNLFIQSFTPVQSYFQAEVTFTSFLFTILTLFAFTFTKSRYISGHKSIDYVGLFSFMLHILAKYPYETDSVVGKGWRFLDLQIPTFASYVVGNGVEFCLNFRAIFYLIIPAVLLKMAARHNWRGIYTDFIPHCVTLSWWQLTLIYAQDATWYSLIRPALALVGVVFFLPLTALTALLLPLYTVYEYIINNQELWTMGATILAALTIPVLTLKRRITGKITKFFTALQVILSVIGIIYFLQKNNINLVSTYQEVITGETSYVDVSEFTSYCSSFQTVYTDIGRVERELTCSQLSGLPVHWKGKVKRTKIRNIHNPLTSFSNKLPSFISKHFNCWFGTEYPLCSESFRLSFCKTLSSSCHLGNWNNYEFEVAIEINVNDEYILPASLIASHTFYNFTRRLNAEDDIMFIGKLMPNEKGILNSTFPQIELNSIACISCLDTELTEKSDKITITDSYFYNFIKYLLNFLFNPLIVFK